MINRSRWYKLKAMAPAVQWWEKRYIASGYVRGDGSPADKNEVLRLIEWAIRKHKQQDREEDRRHSDNPKQRRRQKGRPDQPAGNHPPSPRSQLSWVPPM